MPRILFLSKGSHSASTRYRALDFFSYFQAAGWQAEHRAIGTDLFGMLRALPALRRADVVVLVRRSQGGLPLKLLRWAARRLVFDFDDAIFLNSDGRASGKRMRRFAATVALCDQIWAGNSYLAETAAEHADPARVFLTPTCLEPGPYAVAEPKPADRVDLVWVGSRSTRRYVEPLLPVLEAAAARVPGLRLKLIADFELHSQRMPVLNLPWSAEREAKALASAHIGIAPMPDNPWTRGKCALKVLQYMAAGLPVVSSPAGVNRDLVEEGQTGFLAEGETAWVDAIARLAESEALRRRLGEEGRKRCGARYSRAAVFADLLARLGR